MWRFYFAQHTVSLATHIALEEVGASFEAVRIDFGSAEQRAPDFLAINPKGRVPALITEQGTLTETPAMLFFVAQSFPEAALAPLDDPFALAKMQEFNSYIASTLHVAHAHRMRGYRWVDDKASVEAMKKKVPETIAASFQHVEEWYLKGPYVMGDRYTVADAYLFTVAQWMEGDGVAREQFPKVHQHFEMMSQRGAVERALASQFSD